MHKEAATTNTAQILNGKTGLYTVQGLGGKMPYKVMKSGTNFQVFKLGDDGKPTGKALGTHPNRAKALEQMKALYASEKGAAKKELPDLRQLKEGETVTLDAGTYSISNAVDLTGNINGSTVTKDYDYDDDMPMMASPSYGATSFNDLLAQRDAQEIAQVLGGLTDDFGMLAYNISCNPLITDKASALSRLAKEYQELMSTYAQHEATGESLADELEETKSIVKQIAGDNQPVKPQDTTTVAPLKKETLIWKEGDTYHWIAAYSNNRLDDEQEIISSVSHKEFDEALHKKEWPMPEVYLWHIPYPVGTTDYHAYDASTGFPVAAGHFYKGMEWAAEGIIEKEWEGNSHGMPESWVKYDPDNPKVIIRHRTKEITFLPLWAAANKLTFNIINKEQSMSELEKGLPAHKRPVFVEAFGEARVKQIEEALADKAKEADEAGVVKKEETTQPAGVTHAEIAGVLKEIKGMFETFNTRLDNLEKSVVKEEDKYDLMAILKSKSVIGSDSARIDGRSTLAKDAPVETPNPLASGQHPVGLINNLFAANANWADGRVR